MKFKLVLSIFAFITFLSILGCSEVDETNSNSDNDNKPIKTSNKETTEQPPKTTRPKPPGLTVYVGEEIVRPALGTYNWNYESGDGTSAEIHADSLAPPELVKNHNPTEVTADSNVELDFEKQPDSYIVRIWDDDNNIISNSDKVVLTGKGKVIYDVLVQWEQGTASYSFSLNIE
ncbi:hypothetical protein SAMN04487943_102337 [Gracilibacillus orientalis]|uniref:Lipoprotein n=1 Tax=Gracilibacillus orientalis TaxID=334253 RepID=A0A1I4IWJ0_9BACI|nr:hypothetical protein [Gracilibacillus orientalis]SFL58685.1 hypothetical protein SAMN04487943_102337 [Gracilibacillus orientalis]